MTLDSSLLPACAHNLTTYLSLLPPCHPRCDGQYSLELGDKEDLFPCKLLLWGYFITASVTGLTRDQAEELGVLTVIKRKLLSFGHRIESEFNHGT